MKYIYMLYSFIRIKLYAFARLVREKIDRSELYNFEKPQSIQQIFLFIRRSRSFYIDESIPLASPQLTLNIFNFVRVLMCHWHSVVYEHSKTNNIKMFWPISMWWGWFGIIYFVGDGGGVRGAVSTNTHTPLFALTSNL